MALKVDNNVAKGLKLKFRTFYKLILTFAEVKEKKLAKFLQKFAKDVL